MGQTCCQADNSDQKYTLEPQFQGNAKFMNEEKMPRIEEEDILAAKTPVIAKSKAILVQRKAHKFSDKYAKGKQVGTGPFGHVYHCWVRDDAIIGVGSDDSDLKEDNGEKKLLTLKILKKNLLSQKPVLDDLLINEFKVLMNARHPNIIRMYDIFQDRQNFFIVQEHLQGQDLYYALNCITFTEEQAIQIIRQTCQALKFLHEQHIVHRDIKSDNLILLDCPEEERAQHSPQIQVKLTDFGLAAKTDPELGGLRGFAGTPEYMAPEVVRQPGNKALQQHDVPLPVPLITQKVDIFAIGVLTYEVLTGSTAFSFACKSSRRLYMAILGKEPQYKEEVFQYCTEDCIDFIKQCLIKDPDMRPSVHDLLRHPWLNQYDQSQTLTSSSLLVVDPRHPQQLSQPFKEQSSDSMMDRQMAAEFAALLFTKMAWVRQSQETVVRLADVFRSINISGNWQLTKMEVYRGLADNYGDMGFSEAEWEGMFELMETYNNKDESINFQQFVYGVAAYQRNLNQNKIRDTFQLVDLRGEGKFEMNHVRLILQEELGNNGGSGASIGADVQVWLHIVEELEKDGDRPITFEEFFDAILLVIQRGLAEDIVIGNQQRDRGLRTSIIFV